MRVKASIYAVSVPSEIGLILGNEAHFWKHFVLVVNDTLSSTSMFLYDILEIRNMEESIRHKEYFSTVNNGVE